MSTSPRRNRRGTWSDEDFKQVMREINKRLLIATLILIGVGLAVIGLIAWLG